MFASDVVYGLNVVHSIGSVCTNRYPDMKLTHEVADAGVAGTSAEQADSQQESVTA